MDNIHDFYNMMEDGNIMLSFKGEVTSDLLTSILQIMESKMETLDEPPKIKKKVYNILVECLQNLYHHIDEDDALTAANEKTALFNCSFLFSEFINGEIIKFLNGNGIAR